MNQPKNPTKYLIFSLFLIIVDQLSKVLVHKYMEQGYSGQIILMGNWLKLHYVLNAGMAFGMELGHEYGKLFLTLFRLIAMCAIGWYLVYLARAGAAKSLLWALAMILGGAVGNVIDSTFYGVIFDNAPADAPTPWFHGKVIDMIFVDPWEGLVPDWVPLWGGQFYSTPIFNIADSCIFVGVCTILIFQANFHPERPEEADSVGDTSEENPQPLDSDQESVAEINSDSSTNSDSVPVAAQYEEESTDKNNSAPTENEVPESVTSQLDTESVPENASEFTVEIDPKPVENLNTESVSEETFNEDKSPEGPYREDKREAQ